MKNKILAIFLALASWAIASDENVLIGKTIAQTVTIKGQPISKASFGSKAIYRWNDSEITFVNDAVTSVTVRNHEKEQQDSRRSAELAGAQHQQALEFNKQIEEKAAANRAREINMSHLAAESQRKIQEDRQRNQLKQDLLNLKRTQLESMRQETMRLQRERDSASANGQKARSFNLTMELTAKQREMEAIKKLQQ
jgi:hypothetical protein